jgi:hypothetical protein
MLMLKIIDKKTGEMKNLIHSYADGTNPEVVIDDTEELVEIKTNQSALIAIEQWKAEQPIPVIVPKSDITKEALLKAEATEEKLNILIEYLGLG